MERGANTFPFHNLLPYSESNEGLFLFFSPSLNWIKENSVATLAIRTFAIQKPTKSVHRITPPPPPRPLKDYAVPSQAEPHNSIAAPAIARNGFELKPSLLSALQQNQFF